MFTCVRAGKKHPQHKIRRSPLCLNQWRTKSRSNSMDADFCVEALEEALAKHGKPEIFNTDQGNQFTSGAWIDVLTDAKIKISMPLSDCLQSPAGNRWQRRAARQSHDRTSMAIVEI